MRGKATVAYQVHILGGAGSTPAPASYGDYMKEYINTIVQSTTKHILETFCNDAPLEKGEILEICMLLNFELLRKNGHVNG